MCRRVSSFEVPPAEARARTFFRRLYGTSEVVLFQNRRFIKLSFDRAK